MRTIITSQNYTIQAPDLYTYIFAPNLLRLTLGEIYDEDESVTISANGVSLTRKAINSVVLFDLMPIFESKFPNTQFDITFFSTVDDPLYRASFNVIITAQEVDTSLAFILRWGALQHDDCLLYTDYRFPFWTGKTVAINNPLEHYYWSHNSGTGATGTTPKLIHLLPSAEFVYTITNGSSVQNITYYPLACPSNGAYLRWVDSWGRVLSYNFHTSKINGTSTATQQISSKQSYPINYEDTLKGRDLPILKPKNRTFQCFSSVDNDIYHLVQSVTSSPIVFLQVGARWVRVNITPQTTTPNVGWMSDIEFTIELPRDYVQRL